MHRTTDFLGVDRPLQLECGQTLERFQLAYEMYGRPNASRSNIILICHALTGDQYVASENPATSRPGWWMEIVGPGRPVDTDEYCVICSNVLGGCMGSAGPSTLRAETGCAWGTEFPLITIGDMVEAQALLLDYIGVDKLFGVIGGSMGGMQALEWMCRFPNRMDRVVVIAASHWQHVQNIAFHEAGRQAIMNDPQWAGGDYEAKGLFPERGLSIARMIAHVTYLSPSALHEKFGRRLQDQSFRSYKFGAEFQIESYLRHQGSAFVERFDPNSYLYITRAVDYFDQAEKHGGDLNEAYQKALAGAGLKVCLISFGSDWMYPPKESERIETSLRATGVSVEGHVLNTEYGHDSFLLKNEEVEGILRYFLNRE